MKKPDNSRPLMTEDLDTCAVCRAPATSWRDGPGRVAEGVCDEHTAHKTQDISPPCCGQCHRPAGRGARECRPYGPGGSLLCAGCMFGEDGAAPDPTLQAEAGRQFAGRLSKAGRDAKGGPVAIGDIAGPRPHRVKGRN